MRKRVKAERDFVREDAEQRQRNTVWPDTLRGGRSADDYLWNGNPKAPTVQRIGAMVFGIAFLAGAVAAGSIGVQKSGWPFLIPCALAGLVGLRLIRNALLRPKKTAFDTQHR